MLDCVQICISMTIIDIYTYDFVDIFIGVCVSYNILLKFNLKKQELYKFMRQFGPLNSPLTITIRKKPKVPYLGYIFICIYSLNMEYFIDWC
jgi:hypothetical protein